MQFTKTTLFAVALIALTSAQSALAATPPAQPNNGQVKPPNNGGEKVSSIVSDHSNGNLPGSGNNNNGAAQGQRKGAPYPRHSHFHSQQQRGGVFPHKKFGQIHKEPQSQQSRRK